MTAEDDRRAFALAAYNGQSMNTKTFTGGTRTEAMELATKWWASQESFMQVGHHQLQGDLARNVVRTHRPFPSRQ
jgi:hypothetical protein